MQYARTPPRLCRLFDASPLYFITFGTYLRCQCLATFAVKNAVVSFAGASIRRGIAVGRFMIMPDHIHLFVCGPETFRLSPWVGRLKQSITQTLEREGNARLRHAATGETLPLWQRGFFDHVLRSSESYAEKWEYVRMNPVRKGLVATSDEWQWQGEPSQIDRS